MMKKTNYIIELHNILKRWNYEIQQKSSPTMDKSDLYELRLQLEKLLIEMINEHRDETFEIIRDISLKQNISKKNMNEEQKTEAMEELKKM